MTGKITELYYSLLRLSLIGKEIEGKVSLSPEEWKELYEFSRRQATHSVIYDAISMLGERADIDEVTLSRFKFSVETIEKRNHQINKVREAQEKAWSRRGIKAIELKGSTVAKLYPVPEHRICGDIDWWFPGEKDWEMAIDAVRDNGLTMKIDSDGDVHYTLGGIVIEHHRTGLKEESPAGVIAFLCAHIARHAMVFGVGMRQICDYALATQHFEGQYDKEKLREFVKAYGLGGFKEILDDVVGYVFHDGELTENASKLLKLIELDGNFGHSKKFRLEGLFLRTSFFLRIAPKPFFRIWAGLGKGRIKRIFNSI